MSESCYQLTNQVSLASVSASVEALGVSLKATRAEVEIARSGPIPEGDHFVHKLSAFLHDAEGKIVRVTALHDSMQRETARLMAFYGEKQDREGSMKPEDMFALVASFASALQVNISKGHG